MWYRLAINLSNISGLNSTETNVTPSVGVSNSIPEKIKSGIETNIDKVDDIYHYVGMDPDSESFRKSADNILEFSHQLVPILSFLIKIIESKSPIKHFISKYFSLTGLAADAYNIKDVCKQLENIEDAKLRVARFKEYFKASGGMHGVLTGMLAVFNTITKFINTLSHLNVHSPVDLNTVSMAFSLGEYFMEESREDEHKSGVNLLKTKVVNPHIEFLIKKNPKNKIVINYVAKLIKDNPDLRHDEVRDNALKFFLRDKKKNKFRHISGSKFYYLDIVHIVDNLYEDPHDHIPILKGKRINKEYFDKFMEFIGNASSIQMKINRATFNLNKLILMLPHL
jgi:hypothetical protein